MTISERGSPSAIDRGQRIGHRAESFFPTAPFPLQRDVFSSWDAPDFNRAVTFIPPVHAGLRAAVDAQAEISPVFAQISLLPRPVRLRTLGKR
jgi:hypothetical protein